MAKLSYIDYLEKNWLKILISAVLIVLVLVPIQMYGPLQRTFDHSLVRSLINASFITLIP